MKKLLSFLGKQLAKKIHIVGKYLKSLGNVLSTQGEIKLAIECNKETIENIA